jgi:hypothetical protein
MPQFITTTIITFFVFINVSFSKAVHTPGNNNDVHKACWSYLQKKDTGNLNFLKKYAGKYPHDVKLLNNTTLTTRLKKLLGNRYAFLKKTWAVETPIEINNNVFSAGGCQTHNCSDTNFIIVVDFSKNILYAGIREENKVKVYAEDASTNQQVTDWAAHK